MFKIGDFSKLTFVSVRMLRYYDEIDLFKPIKVDDFTNYRYYSSSQIPALNTIITFKELGFSSEEIRNVLQEDPIKHLEFLQLKAKELGSKLEQDQHRLNKLSHYIKHYNEESNMMKYEVVIKNIPSLKVVSLRKTIPAYDQEGLLWEELMEKAPKQHIQFGSKSMARFHEEETENGVDVEICCEVQSLQENKDGLVFQELEAIHDAATVLVTGPYSPNIQLGFNYIAKWMEENNYTFAGPTRTDYLKGYGTEENPENFLTEIIIPIKKKA